MNIDKVYNFLNFVSAKGASRFSGNLSPKEFNLSIARSFSEWVMKSYNNVDADRPTKEGYERNQKITDNLSFLKVPEYVVQVGVDGRFPKPDNYLHLNYISYNKAVLIDGVTDVTVKGVDIVRDNELSKFLGSHIYKKALRKKDYVMATVGADNITVYPNDVQRVNFSYLRKQIDPVWAFTLQNGRPVYDPVNSVDLEAPDEVANEIIMMAASYLGINIREPELVNYSEMMKEQGV